MDAPPLGDRRSGRRRRKDQVGQLLRRRDLRGLTALGERGPAALASTLVGLLNERDDLLRWRAVEALGLLAQRVAEDDLDRVRDWVRRQFWMMTEESGGIAWHAPEAIGEMLYRVPPLAPEFTTQLMGHYDEAPFPAGCYWAMARLAPRHPDLVAELVPELLEGLQSDLPQVRGHAAQALGELQVAAAAGPLAALADDQAPVVCYEFDAGELTRRTVGQLAHAALARAR